MAQTQMRIRNFFERRLGQAVVLTAAMFFARAVQARTTHIRVAAAADLQFAMNDLAALYEKETHIRIDVTYGSSGNFFAQIQNGAPFDLFFSADADYPRRLDAASLAEPGSLWIYAIGRIVMWTPGDSPVDIAKRQWSALLDPAVRKIAVANPEHAPYGRAAVAAMKNAGIYDRVRDKLVYGENISQAAAFVQSGNAQVGIIALALALSPAMRDGQSWEIPASQHSPIEQAAVALKNSANKAAARAFLEFVKSAAGREILLRYGFMTPDKNQSEQSTDDSKARGD